MADKDNRDYQDLLAFHVSGTISEGTGVIALFPRYELLKSPFPEFAFSPGRGLIVVK